MGASPAIHPSADALRAFDLGKLDDSTASVKRSWARCCACWRGVEKIIDTPA
jgi:hypothetical protein